MASRESVGVAEMNETVQSYKDLDVWRTAIDLVERSYNLTSRYPKDEVYGLTSQIRRSATSIAANIAEGWGRDQTGQYIQFLRIAQGSTRELETHLIIAQRIGMPVPGPEQDPAPLCDRVGRMLRALIRSLESRNDSR